MTSELEYPVYVISKGRPDRCLTARFLLNAEVPFYLVVEPHEREEYSKAVDSSKILSLPFSNLGQGSIPARNWVWEHSISAGHEKHWILDDNINRVCECKMSDGRLIRPTCSSKVALSNIEKFIGRYKNVGIAGPNYKGFITNSNKKPPFRINCHIYSCLLISNDMPFRWRGRYNEDTDLCLQALGGGFCTVQIQEYVIDKMVTMTMKGGNSTELYKGDGRLKMARSLERNWPGIVQVKRRFGRPQHVINWRKFRTKLIPV